MQRLTNTRKRLARALIVAGGAALGLGMTCASMAAASQQSTPSRDERMGEALKDYRTKVKEHANDGPAQRVEASMHRGVEKTGDAIKRGKDKTLDAVGTGMQKSGEAIDRAGRKVESKAKD